MKNKYLKIVGFVLVVAGVAVSLHLGVHQEMNWGKLMRENVEALTTPETEKPSYYCIQAKGFCFLNGIRINGIELFE